MLYVTCFYKNHKKSGDASYGILDLLFSKKIKHNPFMSPVFTKSGKICARRGKKVKKVKKNLKKIYVNFFITFS
jgi:hypothetical protein